MSFSSVIFYASITVGLHLSVSPVIRIGLSFRVNFLRILQNELAWNYRLSDQVQDSVMAPRTSNQVWSKCLDVGAMSVAMKESNLLLEIRELFEYRRFLRDRKH